MRINKIQAFKKVLDYLEINYKSIKKFKLESILLLDDPDTDELKGYDFQFVKTVHNDDYYLNMWFLFPNKISCLGKQTIRARKNLRGYQLAPINMKKEQQLFKQFLTKISK